MQTEWSHKEVLVEIKVTHMAVQLLSEQFSGVCHTVCK